MKNLIMTNYSVDQSGFEHTFLRISSQVHLSTELLDVGYQTCWTITYAFSDSQLST